MKDLSLSHFFRSRGFSFVEVLAAIAIIGIVTFLAIPNLIQIKQDGEDKLAMSRAEALNMAIASYIQANGKGASWPTDNSERYDKVKPYLSFAPTSLALYTPSGYGFYFPTDLTNLSYANMAYASNSHGRLE
jgi:prepilin-type N-terminal cleavage/methylation domain-containing protein